MHGPDDCEYCPKLKQRIQELKDSEERLQYNLDLHHNYYACVARKVMDAQIDTLHYNYLKKLGQLEKLLRDNRIDIPDSL